MSTAPSLLQTARALVTRDVQLLWRRRGDALQPALFALLVVVLFALGLGTSPQALSKVAPAVLWVAVLLAGLLSLDTLFRGDAEDGSLEQWILAPVPLAWLVLVRVLLHWATTALPLIVVSPLLAEMLHLPVGDYVRLRFSDDGCGMGADHAERIFEPFYSTQSGAGSGLGLTFCKNVVESARGTLSVHSEISRGAVFMIDLPLTQIPRALTDTPD